MKNKSLVLCLSSSVICGGTLAAPSEPEQGKRWVINPLFSAEFNGDALNAEKWLDYHPYWEGCVPAIFDPSFKIDLRTSGESTIFGFH